MRTIWLAGLVAVALTLGCDDGEDTTRADDIEDAGQSGPDRSFPLDSGAVDSGALDSAAADVGPDGMAPDGMLADMAPDGMLADMAPDGMLADMSPDGMSTDMASDGMSADMAPDMAPGECAGEGESVAVVPDAPPCCDGLEAIPCDMPNDEGNACPGGCAGAVICADCGNGICGPGENPCNCALDCPAPGAACAETADCVDRPAPIRCLGLWRCDPDASYPSDARDESGCGYSCLGSLTGCDDDGDCVPPDTCIACPLDGGCEDRFGVCGDPANIQ